MRQEQLGLLAVMVLALAGCGNAFAGPPALKDTLNRTAGELRAQAPALFAEDFGEMKFVPRVEGKDTLVLRFENAPVGSKAFDPNVIQRTVRPKVCEIGALRTVIESGGRIKLELASPIGAELPPVLFSRC